MRRVRIGLAFVVAWLLALLLSYLISQKLVNIVTVDLLVRALIDVVAVLVLLIIGGALGTLIMPDLPRLAELVRTTLRALVGLGILSTLILIAAMLGLIPPRWLAWVITLALLAILHKPAMRWSRETLDQMLLPFTHPADPLTRWIQRLVLILLGLALLPAMAPPTAWDALTYHLAGPQQYITAGRVLPFAENHFLGFPQLTEMLFLWLMLLTRPQTAALIHWAFGILTILLLIGFGRHIRRPAAGWIAAAVLLAGYSFWSEFTWPYNDLAATAYITGAVLLLLAANEIGPARRAPFMVWIGIFAGFAMCTKYTAAGATIGIAALLLWTTRDEPIPNRIRRLVIVTSIALIIFAPYLIKNVLLYRNPVFPFGAPTPAFDALDQWYYLRPGTGLSLIQLILLPAEATVFGSEGLAPYGASIGALVFGLLPLPLIAWRFRVRAEKDTLIALAVFVIPAYVIWLVGTGVSWFLVQTRLLYPVFPALALIGALGLEGLSSLPATRDLLKLVRAAIIAALCANMLFAGIWVARTAPLRVILGLQQPSDYLAERLGAHYPVMQYVSALPEGSRVLTLWEPRVLYCGDRCVPDSMIDQWWHDRQTYGDPATIIEHWRAQGYTHVLIFESGWRFLYDQEPYDPLTEADITALEELRSQLTFVWDGFGAYTLYALDMEP